MDWLGFFHGHVGVDFSREFFGAAKLGRKLPFQ